MSPQIVPVGRKYLEYLLSIVEILAYKMTTICTFSGQVKTYY